MGNIQPAAAARPRRRLLLRLVAALLVAVGLYALFGFLILPALIKSQAPKQIEAKLGRPASIANVDVNPFRLTLAVQDFRLMEADGKSVFAAVDALQVDLAAESLFRLAPVIQQLRIAGPKLSVVRDKAGRYNFDDILERLAQEPKSEERARFAINNIALEGGRIDFDDRPAGARHAVTDVRIGVPFISSLPSQVEIFVQPMLSARVNNTPLHLEGKLRPFAETREAVLLLEADELDLTRYLAYLPPSMRLRIPGGRLDLRMTASFRQQPGQSPALVLDGGATVKGLQVLEPDGKPVLRLGELALTLRQANVLGPRIDIARIAATGLQAEVTRGADNVWNVSRLLPGQPSQPPQPATAAKPARKEADGIASVNLQEFALRDATLRYVDHYGPQRITVERLDLGLRRLALDLGKRSLRVGEVASTRADLLVLPNVAQATQVTQVTPAATPAAKEDRAAGKADAGAGYQYLVDTIRISGWSARLEDGAQPKPATTTIAPLGLTLKGLSSTPGTAARLELDAAVNRGGRLTAEGEITPEPLQADLGLTLKDVDLLPLQPYITQRVNLRMTRGSLSGSGRLQLATDKDRGLGGSFRGNLGIGTLATVDKASNTDFLRWKSLSMTGVDLRLQPLSVAVDQVALDDFFARVIIDPNGRINLQDVIRPEPQAQASATKTQAAAPAPAGAGKTPPITVRKLTLQGGRVRFTDNFIKPNYSATLGQFGGSVTGLSSDPGSSAAVDLRGEVNNAPLSVGGRINPLRGDLFLDLKANVRGMELAPLSPYSGRYVGYAIEKGKLSFEVAYRVEQRQLTAENRLILDQLSFGEKVDSPGAADLPVRFAVALLADSNGVIDVNLPISGSFDDPQFSIGGLLMRVLGNVIVKAATQPFRLLGAVFGGGGNEELSTVEFDAGRAALRPDAEAKLGTIARALAERPALKLEIAGRVDPDSDLPGLRRAAVDRKVRSLKARDIAAAGGNAPRLSAVTVTPEEYPELLRRVYRDETFDKPRNLLGLPKQLSVPVMESLIAGHAEPDQDDLIALGNQRASAVRNWLTNNGQVSGERIYLLAPRIGQPEGGQASARAELALR
ncbi:DUF748 domain-containing protein [Noviherbaspirillum aridicola]|uniref:DUF748 domain-containing protein n=1 Tax=Noviherbaspirillum aridicola TaxID=2849687 RepID=A0ABQ4Q316_9BURK|nr:DUF748 domain-containing protein [Noviherbaspirillum aridicola]GIZ51437.1 hypothetical protein NCCP691_14510 [Noviherbaspirillum aridicola]